MSVGTARTLYRSLSWPSDATAAQKSELLRLFIECAPPLQTDYSIYFQLLDADLVTTTTTSKSLTTSNSRSTSTASTSSSINSSSISVPQPGSTSSASSSILPSQTNTSQAQTNDAHKAQSGSLGPGAIAGITIGAVGVSALVIIAILLYMRHSAQAKKRPISEVSQATTMWGALSSERSELPFPEITTAAFGNGRQSKFERAHLLQNHERFEIGARDEPSGPYELSAHARETTLREK